MGLGFLIILVVSAVFLNGCESNNKSEDTPKPMPGDDVEPATAEEVIEHIKQANSSYIVEGAQLVCTGADLKGMPSRCLTKKQDGCEYTQGRTDLCHKDIELDPAYDIEFSECRMIPDKKCIPDIENKEWKDYEASKAIGDGFGMLKDKAYMICSTGIGIIYATDDGQRVGKMEEFGKKFLLDQLVSEEMLLKINERWDMEAFKEAYGSDALTHLKNSMYDANIVDKTSILMFLCTLGVESAYGKKTTEIYDDDHFDDKKYTMNTRGAGLIQLTHETQKYYLNYLLKTLPENDSKMAEINKLLGGYKTVKNKKGMNAIDNDNSVTDFIAQNYPIDSATWYWGINKRNVVIGETYISINEYVLKNINGNKNTLFAATQGMVNGSQYDGDRWEELIDHEEELFIVKKENCPRPEDPAAKEHKYREYCLTAPFNEERHTYGPNGWEERVSDWNNAKDY